MALADSLQTSARVHLDVIPSAEEALCDLGTFDFVASYLLSAGGRQSSAVTELLHIIKSLKEIHTKVQGMIS